MTTQAITIPDKPVPPSRVNPQMSLYYGAPKCGKTVIAAALPDSILIVADPSGADYVTARKVDVKNWGELQQVLAQLITARQAGKPLARRLVIDTISAVEEWLDAVCLQEYLKTPLGKTYTGTSIIELPQGAGYGRTRDKMAELLWTFSQAADEVILLGHIRDRALVRGPNEADQLNSKDIDLVGKVRQLVCSRCSAIGYLKRSPDGLTLTADFRTTDSVNCGNRAPHLSGKEIVVSRRQPDGTVKVSWDAIFLPDAKP